MLAEKVCLIVEPTYITSVWFKKSIAGLQEGAAKSRLSLRGINHIDDLKNEDTHAVVLVSATTNWTADQICTLSKYGMKTILVGAVPGNFGETVSGPVLNRQALVESTVKYFHQAGRLRIASVGNEYQDFNDDLRRHAFLQAMHALGLHACDDDVYSMHSDIDECVESFLNHIEHYDAAICVNDYVAVRLLADARQRGIKIPERLFVAGSGNMVISACTNPTLTTSTLDYHEAGVQAINIWRILKKNPTLTSVNVTIPCEIICRGSTKCIPVQAPRVSEAPQRAAEVPETTRPLLSQLKHLENCLLQCDTLDWNIIHGIMSGKSYEKIAMEFFVAQGTVHYRLKKLYAALDVGSRKMFEKLLQPYITNFDDLTMR